jgi:2-polyprenyl-6-hydroxyphenyl methylase/3-demethylubiquinone-9 3-methyltransferase
VPGAALNEDRFEFGRNWESYAQLVDEERVQYAEQRLSSMLGIRDLSGKTVLDIGWVRCIRSRRSNGARQVLAIDLDPRSVAAAGKVLSGSGRVRTQQSRT